MPGLGATLSLAYVQGLVRVTEPAQPSYTRLTHLSPETEEWYEGNFYCGERKKKAERLRRPLSRAHYLHSLIELHSILFTKGNLLT